MWILRFHLSDELICWKTVHFLATYELPSPKVLYRRPLHPSHQGDLVKEKLSASLAFILDVEKLAEKAQEQLERRRLKSTIHSLCLSSSFDLVLWPAVSHFFIVFLGWNQNNIKHKIETLFFFLSLFWSQVIWRISSSLMITVEMQLILFQRKKEM